jgi:AMMECR1 domain-containing protein
MSKKVKPHRQAGYSENRKSTCLQVRGSIGPHNFSKIVYEVLDCLAHTAAAEDKRARRSGRRVLRNIGLSLTLLFSLLYLLNEQTKTVRGYPTGMQHQQL